VLVFVLIALYLFSCLFCGFTKQVVGVTKMPRYHLFGESLTIAEEMEKHSKADVVTVSSMTYFLLKSTFIMHKAGQINVNGNQIPYYILRHRKARRPSVKEKD